MAGPSLELEMAIKDGKALLGMEKFASEETKIEKGAAGIARELKKAEAELDRFAKRTTAIHATPVEKYTAQMQRLDQALQKGKISQETYARAVQSAKKSLEDQGKAQQSALGTDALGQVKAFATGYLTLQAAVNLVADAFRHARQESEAALGSLRSHDDQRRKLVQMADSPEDLRQMLARADQAAKATGVNRGTAYDVLFQARSFGFEQEYEDILGANEVIKADAAAQLAGKVATMFGGKISGKQAINMALAAGKPSEVDAEDIAGSLAMALEGGRRVGATPDETFAWVSTLSAAFKSPQVAADRIKALTNRAAATPELRDAGGMTEILKRLQTMPEGQRRKILKEDQETNAAYEAMSEFFGKQQEIEAAVRAAREGTGGGRDPLAIGRQVARSTPQTRASLLARQAEIGKEFAREQALSGAEAERVAAISSLKQGAYRRRLGVGGQYGLDLFAGAASMGQTSGTMAQLAGLLGAGVGILGESSLRGAMAVGSGELWGLGARGAGGLATASVRGVEGAATGMGLLSAMVRLLTDIRDDGKRGSVDRTGRSGRVLQNQALQPLE